MSPGGSATFPPLRTPLLRVDGVFVKPEYLNPSGSVKDRAARYVLEEGIRSGRLRAGDEVIEPTSGNAGIALAFWAARFGLQATPRLGAGFTKSPL